jgi:hypothetical protein
VILLVQGRQRHYTWGVMDREDRNAAACQQELLAAQEKVEEFEALMDEYGVGEPGRWVLRQWVEETLMGPILDMRERVLRGIQRRN